VPSIIVFKWNYYDYDFLFNKIIAFSYCGYARRLFGQWKKVKILRGAAS